MTWMEAVDPYTRTLSRARFDCDKFVVFYYCRLSYTLVRQVVSALG
jgi:hypothetical protein